MKKYPQPFLFKPQHPEKYVGKVNVIVCRSNLEFQFFKFFDSEPSIVRWGSEEINIPYFYEVDEQVHRYFPDIVIECLQPDNSTKKHICEIKPFSLCQPPKPPKRMTQQYIQRANDYIRNQNKWSAAKNFCEKNNCEFQILTERDLAFHKK